MDSEYMKSIKRLQQQMGPIAKPLIDIQKSAQIIFDGLKIEQMWLKELKSISGLSTMQEYFKQINEPLKAIQEVLEHSGLYSPIHGSNVDMLNNFYWVIPFEYKYENLNALSEYKDLKEYETYMLKYFNNDRIKRMFSKVREQCCENDKKKVLRQVEKAFFNEDYAICITTLITLLDGLTLSLVAQDSMYQHLSYQAIDALLDYLSEYKNKYELCLKVQILNNFYMILYENENFKNNENKKLSRHLNSHGIRYWNTKIDVLRVLNAICFCQEIIVETKLQEQFIRTKEDRKFKLKGSDKNERNNRNNRNNRNTIK